MRGFGPALLRGTMRFTESEYAALQIRRGVKGESKGFTCILPETPATVEARAEIRPREMNKTEAAYGNYLEALKHSGQVLWYEFEGIKLRLADKTFYTPDYAVIAKDGVMEMHEVKGFWRDDARVKIKVAAAMYPFRFLAVKKGRDGWERENI